LILHETTLASAVILAVQGRLDSVHAPALRSRLEQMAAAGTTRIVLDLTQVGFISSAGLHVLLTTGQLLSGQGGQMVLAGLSPENRRLFDLAGFTDLFVIAADREAGAGKLG
jgi:anti-anti-sigma factor